MATDYSQNSYAETIFSAEEYEGSSRPASRSSGTTWDDTFPRYVPPHRRGVNLEMGDHVVVESLRPEDKQGVENHAFQKLLVPVYFALVKDMIVKLSRAFPGMFFVSKSHDNHDHPFSHVVTQVGTRLLQRMFVPGSKILDVYGSPLACAKYNKSQAPAKNPKWMFANVVRTGGTNFIREVNKWGPIIGSEGINYITGHVKRLAPSFLRKFDCFQLIHTLYYLNNEDLVTLLHSEQDPNAVQPCLRKKALCLIHSHVGEQGSINEGEQTFIVRNGIVAQTNVKTNSRYLHPNITPFWFMNKKEWYGEDGRGFVWELHTVCQDTWIVEIVQASRSEIDPDFDNDDWENMFDLGVFDDIQKQKHVPVKQPVRMLPTNNGKFIELNVNNLELFSELRSFAVGRPREGVKGAELMKELITRGRTLVQPSRLFPDREPMACVEGTLVDHCVSAFVTDLEREQNLLACLDGLQGMIYKHAVSVTGKRPATFQAADLMGNLKFLAATGAHGAKVIRSKDPVGAALSGLENLLK